MPSSETDRAVVGVRVHPAREPPARTDPSPVRSCRGPVESVTCTGPVAGTDVQRVPEAPRPYAAVPFLHLDGDARGTSMRCLAARSATTPEQCMRSTSRSSSIFQVTSGSVPTATDPGEPPGDLDLPGRVVVRGDDLQGGVVGVDGEECGPEGRRTGARGPCRPRRRHRRRGPPPRTATAPTGGERANGNGAGGHDDLPLGRLRGAASGPPGAEAALVDEALRPYGARARAGIRATTGSGVGLTPGRGGSGVNTFAGQWPGPCRLSTRPGCVAQG